MFSVNFKDVAQWTESWPELYNLTRHQDTCEDVDDSRLTALTSRYSQDSFLFLISYLAEISEFKLIVFIFLDSRAI